jgi:hypothetical protein
MPRRTPPFKLGIDVRKRTEELYDLIAKGCPKSFSELPDIREMEINESVNFSGVRYHHEDYTPSDFKKFLEAILSREGMHLVSDIKGVYVSTSGLTLYFDRKLDRYSTDGTFKLLRDKRTESDIIRIELGRLEQLK